MSGSLIGQQDKLPADVLDYDARFFKWLTAGDVITDAEVEIGTGLTVVVELTEIADQVVKVWLSGGVAGESGIVTVTATTANNRTKVVYFRLDIKDG